MLDHITIIIALDFVSGTTLLMEICILYCTRKIVGTSVSEIGDINVGHTWSFLNL
jgi:hypothetical protein